MMVGVAWIYATAWASPPLFGWNKYGLEGFGTSCSFDFVTDSMLYKSFVIAIGAGGFLLPLSIIVCCYVYIFTEISKHKRTFMRTSKELKVVVSAGTNLLSKYPLDVKTAQIAFCCVVLFCVSWTPYAVIGWLGVLGFRDLINPWAVFLSAVFAKGSTLYNPIVYALSHPRFRKKVQTLRHGCGRASIHSQTSGSGNFHAQLQRRLTSPSVRQLDRSHKDTFSRYPSEAATFKESSASEEDKSDLHSILTKLAPKKPSECPCDTHLLAPGCNHNSDSCESDRV